LFICFIYCRNNKFCIFGRRTKLNVKNARANAALNQISNAEFICADSVEAEIENTECVILDPPRKGSSSVLLKKLADAKTPNVVYISCNPDTLARDAAILIGLGYRMGAVTPVDMFPRTGSIECVTHFTLERSES
jgi:23S rRNA (uracil1939-C5)-methyltransferase